MLPMISLALPSGFAPQSLPGLLPGFSFISDAFSFYCFVSRQRYAGWGLFAKWHQHVAGMEYPLVFVSFLLGAVRGLSL